MKKFLLHNNLPRWIVFFFDQVINSWSFGLAFSILWKFEFNEMQRGHFYLYIGLYLLVSAVTFFVMRIHTGLIRYSSTHDIFRIFSAILTTSIIYAAVFGFWAAPKFQLDSVNIYYVLLINFFISSSLLVLVRLSAKASYYYVKQGDVRGKERVLIYGADAYSLLVKQALEASGKGQFLIKGFLDNKSDKVNKRIQQKPVYGLNDLDRLIEKGELDKLLIISDALQTKKQKKAIEKCIELGIKVVTVPPADQWMSGQLSMNQIKDLKIEDLLQRPAIVIENKEVKKDIANKRVLITGAAGSIGAEIVRQVIGFGPSMVVLCDQAESPLHELQLEVEEQFPDTRIEIFIGDIRNFNRMYTLFKEFSPEIVYHAAAYKHVPMMEANPSEAILTNVQGTKHLADLSLTFEVEKFVMISTDKAVNPTNIMGASKRIAEIYIQSLNSIEKEEGLKKRLAPKTRYITTRFGNVLGSNGSVIPRFRGQIEKGGPVTVTHPEITRYFMTIPEAVQLVLEAGTMGKGGEIFVFDMGQPVKIADLAKKMIKLAGFIPGQDIEIVYSGLRPGEKLYEELLSEEEQTIPTHHKKIHIARVRQYPYKEVQTDLNELFQLNANSDELRVVGKMKELVPEFRSKNSRFEKLDVSVN